MKSYLALEKSLSMSDTQGRHGRPATKPDHVEGTGDEDRSDHRGDDAQNQGNREALYRPGAELEQEKRGQYHANVGVDDGVHRVAKAFVDGQPDRLPMQQLFSHSLEDEHIVVHRQTDG